MKNFLGGSIISGFIFGIAASIFEAFLYARNLANIDIVSVGIMSGVLFGACIGFTTRLLSRSNSISRLKHVVNASILIAAGLFLGVIAIIGLSKLPHGQWRKAISPPEKPVRLLSYSTHSFYNKSEYIFYVQSESGNIFSYTCETFKCHWDNTEVFPDDSLQNASSCYQNRNSVIEYLITPFFLFRKITDYYKYITCDNLGFSYETHLVLLDDGNIWTMFRFSPEDVYRFIAPIFLLASSLAGFISYFVSLI